MKLGKTLRKIFRFAVDNYFISLFIAAILFVGVVSTFKLFFSRPTYIYAKVKMGQGLWWVASRPNLWFAKSVKNGDEQKDLLGKPLATVLEVRYYPYSVTNTLNVGDSSNFYDVYIVFKLRVGKNGKTGTYSFNRSAIGTGSAVDFELPSAQFSSTVIAMSEKPFGDRYIDKVVYLTKEGAAQWEYDAVTPGDKYFDGNRDVFEVLDKRYEGKILTVKTKMALKEQDGTLIFGEEQVMSPGKVLNITTPHFAFTNFVIGKIE